MTEVDPETGKLIEEALDALQGPCDDCGDVAYTCPDERRTILTDLCREVRTGAERLHPAAASDAALHVHNHNHCPEVMHGREPCWPCRRLTLTFQHWEREVSDLRERLETANAACRVATGLAQHRVKEAADLRGRGAKLYEALGNTECRCRLSAECRRCAALSSWDGPEIKEG